MQTEAANEKAPVTKQEPAAPKPKRTRKVGAIMAFNEEWVPVKDWPSRVTTMEQAKKAYTDLKLEGKIQLARAAGTLEAKKELVTKFVA